MTTVQQLLDLPGMRAARGLLALLALAGVLVRSVLTRLVRGITARTPWRRGDAPYRHRGFRWLARIVPALIVMYGIRAVPGISAEAGGVVADLMLALIALMACNAALSVHEMLCAVRQLDPGAEGVPLQIYAHTVVTDFVPHENVQSDIFDHLLAILPESRLRLFQRPTGHDMQIGLDRERAAAPRMTAER